MQLSSDLAVLNQACVLKYVSLVVIYIFNIRKFYLLELLIDVDRVNQAGA